MPRSLRILIVDDDHDIRECFAEILRDEGYETASADSGASALAVLEEIAVDLILLDIMMPKMDGHQFRKRQCADPRFAAIPVLVVTATTAALAWGDLPALPVLRKPCDLAALFGHIARLVGAP